MEKIQIVIAVQNRSLIFTIIEHTLKRWSQAIIYHLLHDCIEKKAKDSHSNYCTGRRAFSTSVSRLPVRGNSIFPINFAFGKGFDHPQEEGQDRVRKIKQKLSFFVQIEICAKNLALANVNYTISDIKQKCSALSVSTLLCLATRGVYERSTIKV